MSSSTGFTMSRPPTPPDPDSAHWEAVEEATELLHEECFQEALYLLRDVVRSDPRNPYAFHFMGVALYELGQLDTSRDAYQAAVRLAPTYLGARVALSHVLRAMGEHRGALREAEQAFKIAPNDGDVLHAVGLAHAALGNRTVARHYLEAFLKTNPEFEVATESRQLLEMLNVERSPDA